MELQPVVKTDIINIHREEQANIVPFDFVTELLAMTLTGRKDEIIFETQEFFCAPGTGIEATTSITAVLESKDVGVNGNDREITLSGTVENRLGRKEIFILYFFIELNRAADLSPEMGCSTHSGTHPLKILCEHGEEQLSDAVFELSLCQKNQFGKKQPLGQVKGFLFVGQDKSAKVN